MHGDILGASPCGDGRALHHGQVSWGLTQTSAWRGRGTSELARGAEAPGWGAADSARRLPQPSRLSLPASAVLAGISLPSEHMGPAPLSPACPPQWLAPPLPAPLPTRPVSCCDVLGFGPWSSWQGDWAAQASQGGPRREEAPRLTVDCTPDRAACAGLFGPPCHRGAGSNVQLGFQR